MFQTSIYFAKNKKKNYTRANFPYVKVTLREFGKKININIKLTGRGCYERVRCILFLLREIFFRRAERSCFHSGTTLWRMNRYHKKLSPSVDSTPRLVFLPLKKKKWKKGRKAHRSPYETLNFLSPNTSEKYFTGRKAFHASTTYRVLNKSKNFRLKFRPQQLPARLLRRCFTFQQFIAVSPRKKKPLYSSP